MKNQIFNRTILLWAGAIIIALLIVNPRAALIQRVNAINGDAVDCLKQENCQDIHSITEAREYYRLLAQLYPDYGRGAEMEGMCYLLLKQDRMAVKKFREAIKHNPDLFWATFELAKAYYRQGDYALALSYFRSIIVQDNGTLLKKAALSSLRQLPDRSREALMIGLIDFVSQIKLESCQMAIGSLVHLGDIAAAQSLISQVEGQWGGNKFFVLASSSLAEDSSRKDMLSWIDALSLSKPAMHPWGRVIQPMKEILYQ